jgi:hypothetical protein
MSARMETCMNALEISVGYEDTVSSESGHADSFNPQQIL